MIILSGTSPVGLSVAAVDIMRLHAKLLTMVMFSLQLIFDGKLKLLFRSSSQFCY